MNIDQACTYIEELQVSGLSLWEILDRVGKVHQHTAAISDDASMVMYRFPEGVLVITPDNEVERYATYVGKTISNHPANCRERLRAEGKPHPRSGCNACDATIFAGLQCPHGELK